jgi:hypothetical protein
MADTDRIDIVRPNDQFWKILAAHTKRTQDDLRTEYMGRTFVGLDPGETTGAAVWAKGEVRLQQLETKDVGQAFLGLRAGLDALKPDHLRVEEYRVYNWMADSHSWSILHTPQLIGAIKVLALLHDIPISFKLAQAAKSTWNDNVLKICGLYNPGLKHARDACRHLLYYMCYPDRNDD